MIKAYFFAKSKKVIICKSRGVFIKSKINDIQFIYKKNTSFHQVFRQSDVECMVSAEIESQGLSV